MKPSVLLVSNHASSKTEPGRVDALQQLTRTRELSAAQAVYAGVRAGESDTQRNRRVIAALAASRADIIVVLSMKRRLTDMEGVERALAGRPLLYWEGDPWGGRKRVSEEMSAWLRMSTIVFSVGGFPQDRLMIDHGAREVHHTIHTYDHILFAAAESHFAWSEARTPAVFLGSNFAKIPGVSGLPGSVQRWQTVLKLRHRLRHRFALAGPGWPRGWGEGAVAFGEQLHFLQSGKVVVNWDHFPRTHGYTSDRLAIAMVAGRAQVSTRHPQMQWAPDEQRGVFLRPSVNDVVQAAERLVTLDEQELQELGRRAREWAIGRVSHRESTRAWLHAFLPDDVDPPPDDPWARLLPHARRP